MTQQTIGIGSAPGDGLGDPARIAFDKTNDNFSELYAAIVLARRQTIILSAGEFESIVETRADLDWYIRFQMPYNFFIEEVSLSVVEGQVSGDTLLVDLRRNSDTSNSIFATPLSLPNGSIRVETLPGQISQQFIDKGDTLDLRVDRIGDGFAYGLKCYIVGYLV